MFFLEGVIWPYLKFVYNFLSWVIYRILIDISLAHWDKEMREIAQKSNEVDFTSPCSGIPLGDFLHVSLIPNNENGWKADRLKYSGSILERSPFKAVESSGDFV